MKNKKGQLSFVGSLIIGLVILGAGTMFVTSDIGQPLFDALNNFMFPEMTAGCDTNSVNSIQALAYALNCVGMSHAGVDVTEICPEQKLFGTKVAVCYGEDDNYNCEVQGFELTKDPEYTDPEGWITGMGDPNCLVYYEAFPEDQAADWKVRVEDLSLITVAIGGAFNVIPIAGQAAGKATKAIRKEVMDGLLNAFEKKASRLYSVARRSKNAMKTINEYVATKVTSARNTITFKAFRDNIYSKQVYNKINSASDDYLSKNLDLPVNQIEQMSEAMTRGTFEAMQATGSKTTRDGLEIVIVKHIDDMSLSRLIYNDQEKAIIDHQYAMIKYVTKKPGKIEMLKRLSLWSSFSDIILKEYSATARKALIEKSARILDKMPKIYRERFMTETDELAQSWLNTIDLKNSRTAQLWGMDMLTDSIPEEGWGEYGESVNAMATCGIMHRGKIISSTGCVFLTSAGIMAAYADNDNEKYNPVGINSLGYKKNYYGVTTEKLADVVNYYYVALKRDAFQENTRFFLASPCKTEKVIVKHEQMSCYYTECHNDMVCCQRKEYDYTNQEYVNSYIEWAPESSCKDFSYVGTVWNNMGNVVKAGLLFDGYVTGGALVMYADLTNNPDLADLGNDWKSGTITVSGHSFDIEMKSWKGFRDKGSFPEKIDNSECEIKNSLPIDDPEYLPLKPMGICRGTYTATTSYLGFFESNLKYFYTDYPLITTIGTENEGIVANTRPNNYGVGEWNSLVEIESPETYYHMYDAINEVEAYNVQAQTALDFENGDTAAELSDIPLYMFPDGNGIKKCLQLSDRMSVVINPWAHDIQTDIDTLTVDVEFDETFEGINYCYSSFGWESAISKTVIFGALLAAEAGVTLISGGTGLAPAMFISGALYEMGAHYIDKWNAWPDRG